MQVTLEGEDGAQRRFRIVGEDEAEPREGRIAWISPVARALMGKWIGDEVSLAGRHDGDRRRRSRAGSYGVVVNVGGTVVNGLVGGFAGTISRGLTQRPSLSAWLQENYRRIAPRPCRAYCLRPSLTLYS